MRKRVARTSLAEGALNHLSGNPPSSSPCIEPSTDHGLYTRRVNVLPYLFKASDQYSHSELEIIMNRIWAIDGAESPLDDLNEGLVRSRAQHELVESFLQR